MRDSPARARPTRVSVASGGAQGNGEQRRSVDLRRRPLRRVRQRRHRTSSRATRTRSTDVFVRDRQRGTTERVSVDSGGTQGERRAASIPRSRPTAASSRSRATPRTSSRATRTRTLDVFVRDRQSGTTERVSVDSGGAQGERRAARSLDLGRRPLRRVRERRRRTSSRATRTLTTDVFVRDRQLGPDRARERGLGRDAGAQRELETRRSRPTAASSRSTASRATSSPATRTASRTSSCATRHGLGVRRVLLRRRERRRLPVRQQRRVGPRLRELGRDGRRAAVGRPATRASRPTRCSSRPSGEKPTALSIFLQGSAAIAPVVFGDGLRCAGGSSSGSTPRTPSAASSSRRCRAIRRSRRAPRALGDPIPLGATRHYQVYYRDRSRGLLPELRRAARSTCSSGIVVAWGA